MAVLIFSLLQDTARSDARVVRNKIPIIFMDPILSLCKYADKAGDFSFRYGGFLVRGRVLAHPALRP